MIRKLGILVISAALIVSCKGKQTATDDQGMSPNGGGDVTAVESTPMGFDAQGSDSGKIDGLATIHFDYDKSNLSAEAKEKIQGNVAWMKKNSSSKLQIEGHCDARGSIEYNLALGERRANAVKAYMVNLGIAGSRLSTISYGKEKPLANGDTEEAYAKNRRANFLPTK